MATFGFERINKANSELNGLEHHNNLIFDALRRIQVLGYLLQGEENTIVLEVTYGLIKEQWLKVTSLLLNNLDSDHIPFRNTLKEQTGLKELLEMAGVATTLSLIYGVDE